MGCLSGPPSHDIEFEHQWLSNCGRVRSRSTSFFGNRYEVWSYALALLLGMLGSLIPGLRKEGATITTTAVFLHSTGFTEDVSALLDKMIEISIGVSNGVRINLIVLPPRFETYKHRVPLKHCG